MKDGSVCPSTPDETLLEGFFSTHSETASLRGLGSIIYGNPSPQYSTYSVYIFVEEVLIVC